MFREIFQLALTHSEPQGWPTFDGLELDRTEFLTSSETAQCLRKAFFSKNNDKYKPKIMGNGTGENGYSERGHAIEAWLVAKMKPLKKLGYTIAFMGKDQRSFYDSDLGISGTPDGLLTTPDGKRWLLEIKSIDPRYNKNNLPKKGHINQTQQNMYLVQKCLGIVLDGAVLVYIDASNVYDIREFPMDYDEEMVQEGFQRSEILWNASEPDDLEPEGIYNGDCEYCAYTHHCSQVVNMQKTLERLGSVAAPFLEGETEGLNAEQRMRVEQYIAAWEGLKQYSNEKEEVEGEVKRVLMEEYRGLMQVDGYKLVGNMQAGRETIDKKLMEADGLDVSKYTKQGAPFVVLKVTPPAE